MRRMYILIWLLALELGFAASSPAQAQKPADPQVAPEELPSVLSVPKDYHYAARARRDPFVNPVPKPKQAAGSVPPPSLVRPPGLRGVLVADVQIAGVVTSREPSMNVVIISAPGNKTPYFGRVGDQLYDGMIKSIQMDTITFALTASEGGVEKAAREIVRRVRPAPGEEK